MASPNSGGEPRPSSSLRHRWRPRSTAVNGIDRLIAGGSRTPGTVPQQDGRRSPGAGREPARLPFFAGAAARPPGSPFIGARGQKNEVGGVQIRDGVPLSLDRGDPGDHRHRHPDHPDHPDRRATTGTRTTDTRSPEHPHPHPSRAPPSPPPRGQGGGTAPVHPPPNSTSTSTITTMSKSIESKSIESMMRT